jgi:hypothetical protein
MFWKKGGCPVSFLGIHKWEPDIYIGFSKASAECNFCPTISKNIFKECRTKES